MSNDLTKPELKVVEFSGLSLDEIKVALLARIKERNQKWNQLTVAYFEAHAADVTLYLKYGFDAVELELSENEFEMLQLISQEKFSAKGIPVIIKNVNVARELKVLSLAQQEELFNRGKIEIVRNHNPMEVKLVDAKPSEIRRAIEIDLGKVKLLNAAEQLKIIDAKPSNSHKHIIELGSAENIMLLEKAKEANVSISTYLRQIILEKIKV